MLLFKFTNNYNLQEVIMNKIKKAGQIFSLFFWVSAWIYPLIIFYGIFFHLEEVMTWAQMGMNKIRPFGSLSLMHQIVIVGLACIPISLIVLICNKLSKLFSLYSKGILFEMANIRLIKAIGFLLIANELIEFIYHPLMIFVLAFTRPFKYITIALNFGTTDLSSLLTGLVLVMVSWIAQEANRLKLEVELTV